MSRNCSASRRLCWALAYFRWADDHAVVVLHHRGDQPARGHVGLGARHRLGGLGAVVVGALAGREEIAVHVRLVVVDVRPVVGDEDPARRAVGLGVDVLVEPVGRGQQRRLGLHGILVREQRRDVRREQLRAVGASALHGIVKRQLKTRARRRADSRKRRRL